jgi:ketosteroid isomerase-like protein
MKRISLFLVAASLLGSIAGAQEGPEAAVSAFHEALASDNRQNVLALLGPEVVIFESGGAELSRDEYASHHLAADMEFAAATEARVVDRRSGGDDEIAWVLTRSETTGTFREREIDSLGVETMVLRRSEDGWRIVHIHWSSRSREKSP